VKRDRFLYLLLIPPLAYLLLFKYWPMWWLSISFKDYRLFKGMEASPWVGFKHYIAFFTGRDFFLLIKNTLLINLYSILFGFPMPILFALLLNEVRGSAFKRTVQTISYLPHFISTVVMVSMVFAFLSPSTGPLNMALRRFGLEPVFFMGKAKYFRTVYIVSGVWQQMGWNAIIYLAALAGIDPTLYEAAMVDGAGRARRLLHITLPSILPTIVIMLVLRIGDLLSVGFERIYLMGNDATRQVSEVIQTYVYRRGIITGDYSFATAVGLFNSVISLILVFGANAISKKTTETGIW